MNEIILSFIGYKVKGVAIIQNWSGKLVETELHPIFIEMDSYNEDKIPVKEGLHTLYKDIESAEVEIYKCYQATIQGQVIEALIYSKTINI